MFKEMVEKKHYTFQQGFDDWKDAVRAACQPLLDDGTIEDIYPEEIIKKVEELGPYIVIAPDICIPHAQEGLGVHETAISFMKTEKPVSFSDDGEHDARLFFVLASTDNAVHLKNLGDMAEALSDDDLVAKLLQAKTPEELVALEE
ncbi:PTS sugar transporter subunit IIA [uncultured Selenomonas sp.]|uniref:PTS sugar transporter subunit IIA n=1 Tax=uncultured Selenomonas sp. TaxID=159275 RepID=UPI0025FF8E87|nr:PTS sugar transporter subunit IIA [uncultured Selenomonas sp.]